MLYYVKLKEINQLYLLTGVSIKLFDIALSKKLFIKNYKNYFTILKKSTKCRNVILIK